MIKKPIPEYPERNAADADYEVLKTLAGAVPVAGGALEKLIDAFIGAPLEKRRRKWHAELIRELATLADKVDQFDPEALVESEEFQATLYAVTDAAMKTSSGKKRDALRNAILNTAIGLSLDESIRDKFLNLVLQLTPIQLRMLAIMEDPNSDPSVLERASQASNGWQMLSLAILEFEGNQDRVQTLYQDLITHGLAKAPTVAMGTRNFAFDSLATQMGKAFLSFIRQPGEIER